MEIDNQKNTYRLWLSRMVMTIVFTLSIIVIIFLPWPEKSETWLSKYYLVILVSLIYIILNLINYLRSPYFVSYSDKGDMIIMRYYPLSLFTSKKHSIEIPKRQFVKYELEDFLFGTQQKIILYQHFRDRIAKFPPISLSAVDKDDREMILQSLAKYASSPTK
jgi:hypothetical protein